MATGRKIILDCDPGVDDAVAALLTFASDEIELLAITTVAGNVPEGRTTDNALRICTLAGRTDVQVYAGCARPLMKNTRDGASVHGEDGLGDIGLGETTHQPQPQHAVDYIISALNAHPSEIDLCVIGPMTNIAVALVKDPSIAGKIRHLYFMGGAVDCPGNTTDTAEFNIWFDPHAAEIVLSSGLPTTMFGLDVTGKATITPEWLGELKGRTGRIGGAAVDMLANYRDGDPSLHDPCVIAYLLDPTLFAGKPRKVSVGLDNGPDYGRTMDRPDAADRPNSLVIDDVDAARLFDLILERMARLDPKPA